jgi:hypothetical protein
VSKCGSNSATIQRDLVAKATGSSAKDAHYLTLNSMLSVRV